MNHKNAKRLSQGIKIMGEGIHFRLDLLEKIETGEELKEQIEKTIKEDAVILSGLIVEFLGEIGK